MRKIERKGTQYTVLHTVKARADKRLRERATFYYPLWWGHAPGIISTFLESYDLDGKIIVPFCTSASSGMGSSADALHSLAPDADWRDGRRFDGNAAQSTVQAWTDELNLPAQAPAGTQTDTQTDTQATARRIAVSDGTHEVVFTLNDSPAARALYA